ncbi:MAG: hypothetical protein ACRD8Z_26570 [Nitrososphaeraceae archaeon]
MLIIALKSGSSITYDVTSPVSIPAGIFIRLEMFGIKNPINPSTAFTATITTRDSGGGLIDGPSPTNVYTIKKIVSADIADGAITWTKPVESFMRRVTVVDNAAGNAVGWNPDGLQQLFDIFIFDDLREQNAGYVSVLFPDTCKSNGILNELEFDVFCNPAPPDGTALHYLAVNLPENIVQ